MGAPSLHKRTPKELWIVMLAASVAALGVVLYGLRANGLLGDAVDPYNYGAIAHHLAEHGFDKVTRRSAMLYPHVLWGIYELGLPDLVALLLHVVWHVGTCVLVFRIGQRLYNDRTAFIAALVVALHPMLVRYIGELHTETLLVFMCTLTAFLALRFHDEPSIKNGILLGALGMVGALVKGVILPILVIYGAVWFFQGLRKKHTSQLNPMLGVVAIALAMSVVLAPWTYRNYAVSGKFVPLTPGTPDAFLRGYIFTRWEFATLQKPPYTDAENESNALFRRLAAENGTTWELDEIVDDANNGREAKRRIREQPLDTLRKCFVGLFTFWYEMTSLRNSLVPASLAVLGWVLAFAGFKRAHEEGRPSWLLLLPILVTNVFVACLIPLGRYSVPILPCLALLAAFGVDTLLTRRSARTVKPILLDARQGAATTAEKVAADPKR